MQFVNYKWKHRIHQAGYFGSLDLGWLAEFRGLCCYCLYKHLAHSFSHRVKEKPCHQPPCSSSHFWMLWFLHSSEHWNANYVCSSLDHPYEELRPQLLATNARKSAGGIPKRNAWKRIWCLKAFQCSCWEQSALSVLPHRYRLEGYGWCSPSCRWGNPHSCRTAPKGAGGYASAMAHFPWHSWNMMLFPAFLWMEFGTVIS